MGEIGVRETGNNGGLPLERYGLPGEEPLPWCARFLRWCFSVGGTPLPGHKYLIGSVTALHDALLERGAILSPGQKPEPGDLVLFHERGKSDKGAGKHIAILELYGDRNLITVDGNWSNSVQRVTRPRADPTIWCFARWPVRPIA